MIINYRKLMMGSFGGIEILLILLIWLLPGLIVVGYFIWVGLKINRISKAQEERNRYLQEIIELLKERV